MSTSTSAAPRMDVERLVLVPVFVFLLMVNSAGLWASRHVLEGSTVLNMLHAVLVTVFYAMLIVLLFFRSPAKGSTRSRSAVAAAYAGSFAPFLLIFNPDRGISNGLVAMVSAVVMLAGLTFTMYGLAFLGRSFGVVPKARVLVQNGPYRFVRHPLYAGEFVTFVGAVMAELTIFSALVFLSWAAIQFYRALQEEKVLRHVFPEYESYMRGTARFLPGLV